jgi:hypothetical protein
MSAAYLKSDAVILSTHIPFWCAGKHRFESARLASEVALRSNRGARTHYRCGLCGGFHVGAIGVEALSRAAARELIR